MYSGQAHRFTEDGVLEVVEPVDVLRAGVGDPDRLVELLVHEDVDVAVDGGARHRPAAVGTVKAGQVGAAPAKLMRRGVRVIITGPVAA